MSMFIMRLNILLAQYTIHFPHGPFFNYFLDDFSIITYTVYFNGAYEWMLERFGVPVIIRNPEFDFNFLTLLKDNTLSSTLKKRLCYAYAWHICGGFSSLLWVESFPAYGDTPASYSTRWVTGKSLEAILNLYHFKVPLESL